MRVEHVIEIDATPPVVWAVTVDVERWPEWTPTMTSVEREDDGPLRVGSRARIEQPGLPQAVWTVTELRDGERFTWETRVRGMNLVATHELAAAEGGTRNALRVQVEGFLARLFWLIIRRSLRRALAQENEGLKRRCESSS